MNILIKEKKVVLIPIETKGRELDGMLLLAYELIGKGFEVVIGPKREVNVSFDLIKPNIYLLDSARKTKDKIAITNKLKDSGTKILVLDTEGAIFTSTDKFLTRLSSEILFKVDYYFCWGDEVKKIINDHNLFPSEKVFVTGYPSFDLTKQRFRTYYQKEVDYLKKKYGKFILINTNFSTINHFSDNLDLTKVDVDKTENGYNKEQLIIIKSILKAISLILDTWKEYKIVIRPHPSENHNFYNKYFEHTDRILVIHQHNPRSWILASDLLIHNGCTTGIEAAMLDEPVISYNVIEKKNNLAIPDRIGESAKTLESLLKKTEDLIGKSKVGSANNKEILNQYFNFYDGFTIEKISSHLSSLELESYKAVNGYKALFIRLKYRLLLTTLPILKLIALNKVKQIVYQFEYDFQKIPFINKNEICGKLKIIAKIHGGNYGFEVNENRGLKSTFTIRKS